MKKRQKKFLLFIMTLFFFAGALYYRTQAQKTIEYMFSYIAYPFMYAQKTFVYPIKRWVEKRNTISELEFLIKKYQEQSQQLLSELVACKANKCFLEETQDLRDYNALSEQDVLIAQVLIRNFSDETHFFLIDQGENSGIALDMIVVYKNCLVGRISAVYPWYSKVVLITDKLCKVPAISVDNKARGIYQGLNTLTHGSFDYVSHLEKINPEELLISSGEGLIFPKGFGLGTIQSFNVNEKDYTYVMHIQPLIDLRTIKYCSVIKKSAPMPTKE